MKHHYLLAICILVTFNSIGQIFAPSIDLINLNPEYFGVSEVKAADLDGDGDMDILATFTYAQIVVWYENLGDTLFTSDQFIGNVGHPSDVFIEDVDNDGDLDVITTSSINDYLVYFENTGDENFIYGFNVQGAGKFVELGDIDGDGDIDFFVGSSHCPTSAWIENDFENVEYVTHWIVEDNLLGHYSVVYHGNLIDIDMDSDLDIVILFSDQGMVFEGEQHHDINSNEIVWIENNGNENDRFEEEHLIDDTDVDSQFFITDHLFTGESPEILIHTLDGGYSVQVFSQDGTDTYNLIDTLFTISYSYFSLLDLDTDQDLDIIFQLGDELLMNLNNGDSIIQENILILDGLCLSPHIDYSDFDQDGDLDFLFVCNGTISWVENTSAWEDADFDDDGVVGSLDLAGFLSVFGESCDMCPFDLNQDGYITTIDLSIFISYFGNP